jgi:hypothetical protein
MSAAQLLRFAAVLVALGGYVVVFRAGEERIAAQTAANAETAGRLVAAGRVLAARAGVERGRARLEGVGRSTGGEGPGETPIADISPDAAAIAAARRTKVTAVTANAAPPANCGPSARVPERGPCETASFRTTAFDVAIEGAYADVLATVRALPAVSHGLASVEIVSLVRKSAALSGTTLTASLGVVLHRPARPLAAPAREGISGVRARPA